VTDNLGAVVVTPAERFESLLKQIEHEDNLLVSRTGWLLTAQSFLLGGYVSVDASKLPADPILPYHHVIGGLGLLSTIFIFSGILAALKVFVELRVEMYLLTQDYPLLPMRRLPRIGAGTGLLSPIFLSLALIFVWTILLIKNWWSAGLIVSSGLLFSAYIIGTAHQLRRSFGTRLLPWALPFAIGSLIAAFAIPVQGVFPSSAGTLVNPITGPSLMASTCAQFQNLLS